MSNVKAPRGAAPAADTPDIVVDPVVGLHYHVCAYVGGSGINPPPFEGSATFTTIYAQRPAGCRYAIAQRYALRAVRTGIGDQFKAVADPKPSGSYVVWDMNDEDLRRGFLTGPGGMTAPPKPVLIGDTEDGTIMKAVMLCDRDG